MTSCRAAFLLASSAAAMTSASKGWGPSPPIVQFSTALRLASTPYGMLRSNSSKLFAKTRERAQNLILIASKVRCVNSSPTIMTTLVIPIKFVVLLAQRQVHRLQRRQIKFAHLRLITHRQRDRKSVV